MKNKILEIVEIGHPKSLIQRQNEPITELVETTTLVEDLNQLLFLSSVRNNAYLVSVKIGHEIENKIIIAIDVFDLERKVFETFKSINSWEISINYGVAIL